MSNCPRCGHELSDHWSPESPNRTTACLTCLDQQQRTEWGSREGICDHTAESILIHLTTYGTTRP